eukprot:GHRR01028463.1.p1 GENE.GHRR01028463.1~~GHRR01028463.1.p1  ORF type:complete len:113 (-),score=11.36 GHRR01028463.1:511-849(-)
MFKGSMANYYHEARAQVKKIKTLQEENKKRAERRAEIIGPVVRHTRVVDCWCHSVSWCFCCIHAIVLLLQWSTASIIHGCHCIFIEALTMHISECALYHIHCALLVVWWTGA